MQEKQNKLNTFLLIFIIFLTSFALWFYTSNIKKENKENILTTTIKDKFLEKDLNLDLFWQVYNIISQNYYFSDIINKKEIEYGTIKWLVGSLQDKFSEFMTPEETKEFENVLKWDFEWIWAVIEKHELWIIIDRVLKWSPAINAWIFAWDIVIEANWNNLKDLTVNQAVNYIKWPAWTQVILKIIRAWENDFITKEIIRDKIKIPSVDTKDLEDDSIWYISLNMFWENTSKEFREMLDVFNNNKTKWIIIDLRDNWWGYLQSAVEILSNFIESKKLLVTTKYSNNLLNNYYYSENKQGIFDKKIVLLINWNSASASEIVAWALKDYNKAILVWEKSYWKWSVQQPFDLPDWSMLKLTIAKWYTPNDKSIDWNGIEPDIKVEFLSEDYENMFDRQLDIAKQVLKKYIEFENISLVVSKFKNN